MTNDRDDLESAKDWLADLGQPADTGSESPEDEVEAVDSGQEEPAPQPARSPQRMLDRPAELVYFDKADKPWWDQRLRDQNFSLVQEGDEVATISTGLELDRNFGRGLRCRHTEVRFKNGDEWTISTHAPGPRQEKKTLGISHRVAWNIGDRIVEVKDGGEQIAYLEEEVKLADGRSITIHPGWRDTFTIKNVKGNYVLTPTSPVPLEAALLDWHVLLGDFSLPSSDSDVGNGD